jgi:hypothetical protein
MTGPIVVLEDGTEVPWGHATKLARQEKIVFRVAGDRNEIEFHMHPDFFQGSLVLAWTGPEERDGRSPYLDRRCRSTVPTDFLSRIESLVSTHDERT